MFDIVLNMLLSPFDLTVYIVYEKFVVCLFVVCLFVCLFVCVFVCLCVCLFPLFP